MSRTNSATSTALRRATADVVPGTPRALNSAKGDCHDDSRLIVPMDAYYVCPARSGRDCGCTRNAVRPAVRPDAVRPDAVPDAVRPDAVRPDDRRLRRRYLRWQG